MSRLKWPGRVERMELERLMKRADALILEGRRRRGLREERFRGLEGGGERDRGIGGVEIGGGEESETGSVTKKTENKNLQPVSGLFSPRTSWINGRATTLCAASNVEIPGKNESWLRKWYDT